VNTRCGEISAEAFAEIFAEVFAEIFAERTVRIEHDVRDQPGL